MLKKEFWFVIVLLLAVSFLSVAAGSESQQKCYFIEVPVLFHEHEHEQSKVEALGALQAAQTITTVENSLQFDSAFFNNRLQFDAVTDNKTGDDALAEDQYRYYGHFDYTGKVGTTRAIQRIDLFQPFLRADERLMFFDVRVGNDSHKNYEYNLGLGFREMASSRLINGFYAYLDGKCSPNRNLFHNITTGYELLFSAFEARINAYIPIGRRSYKLKEITHFYNHYFRVENKTVFQQTHHTIYEKSFGGFDIEIGGAVPYLPQANLYATYYRFMAAGMDAIDGVRVRGSWEINPYFSMEASADFGQKNNQAKYIGFRITIPFGEPPEKPSALERKMVSLPTRDIDIVSDEGQDLIVVDKEVHIDKISPLLIHQVQDHEIFSGNLIFDADHPDHWHHARVTEVLNGQEITEADFSHIRHHIGKEKTHVTGVQDHEIASLPEDEGYYSSFEYSDSDTKSSSSSDNGLLSSDFSSSLSSDSSGYSMPSKSQLPSSSVLSSSVSSLASSSSFPRRRESRKESTHRLRAAFFAKLRKPPPATEEVKKLEPELPKVPVTVTSTSSSNTFCDLNTSSLGDISTSTEGLNASSSDNLSSSSIDIEIRTDLEDQAHQDKIVELEGVNSNLTDQLQISKEEKEDLESQLTTLRSEISTLTTQTEQQKIILEQKIDSLNTQLEANSEQLGQVKDKLQQAEGEVEQLTGLLQQASSEKKAAESQRKVSENRAKTLQEKLSKTNKQVEGLEANKNDLTEANKALKKDVETEQEKLTKANADLKSAQDKSQDLSDLLIKRDQEVQELNKKLTTQETARKTSEDNLQAKIQELNNSQHELNQNLEETEKNLRAEKDEYQRLQQELTRTKQRLTNTKIRNTKTIKRLRRDRANKSRVFTQTKNQLKQVNKKLKTTIEQLQAQMGSNEILSTQLNNQQVENQRLQVKLAQAQQKPETKSVETQTESTESQFIATRVKEEKMAITARMANIQKPSNTITVTDKAGKKKLTFRYDSEIKKYVVSLESHTTTSLIIDKDIMENFREQYKKLNLEQRNEFFGQAYSYLINADSPSLRFGTSKPLVHKDQQLHQATMVESVANHQQGMDDPNNITAQQTTFLSKPPVLALPATNTQPQPQDNGKESDINFGYDNNSKEIYKGIRVFFRDDNSQRYKYVGNLGDSSPFSSEQKAAIESISHKKYKDQIRDVQKALQELANSVPLVTIERRHTTEAKKTIDGDQHHYIAGDLAISEKLRNQDNTIKASPSNTINTSRAFSQDDLSLPKPQLQINQQNLKNALKKSIRTQSIPDLSVSEAFVEAHISPTKAPSVAEMPVTDSSTSPSVSRSLSQASSQTSLLTTASKSTTLGSAEASPHSPSKQQGNMSSDIRLAKTQTLPATSLQHVPTSEANRDAPETQSARVSLTQSPAKTTKLNIQNLSIKRNKPNGEQRQYVCDPSNYRIFTRKRKSIVLKKEYTEYYKIYEDENRNSHQKKEEIVMICTSKGFNINKLTLDAVKIIMQALYPDPNPDLEKGY